MGLPVSALLHRERTVLFIIADITRNPQWWSKSGRLLMVEDKVSGEMRGRKRGKGRLHVAVDRRA
jgi:hypothetical protein